MNVFTRSCSLVFDVFKGVKGLYIENGQMDPLLYCKVTKVLNLKELRKDVFVNFE